MRLTPRHTVKDILVRRAELFNLGRESITAQVAELDVPAYIPRLMWGLPLGGYAIREVGFDLNRPAITLRELEQLQHIENADIRALTRMLSIMLRVSEGEVLKLQFISAYRYFLAVIEQLTTAVEAFSTLSLPEELRLPEDGIKYAELPFRGIPDLVLEAVGVTGYNTMLALPWVVAFRALQQNWRDNVNKRKAIIAERNKQKTQQR